MDLNVIRRVSIEATTKGVAQATGELNKLADAQGNIVQSSEKTEKATLSVERALDRQQRSLDQNYKAMKQFERAQSDLDKAYRQNIVSLDRYNQLTELNRQRLRDATTAAKGLSDIKGEVNAKALAAAGSLGSFGTILAGIGPIGLVVAAGVGAATLGISAMVKAADELADRAGKMVDFAETTGLTTTQLQALQKAAAFVGIEAEKVGTGFEKFTTTLEELRRGTGSLYDGLNRLDPQLTRQLALTKSAGEAWDVLSKAIAEATTQEQKNAIARAAFGRQGIPFTRLAGSTTEAGGLAGLEQSLGAVNTLQAEQLKRWDELKDKIDYTSKLAKQNIASIYTEEVLKAQLQFADGFLKFSQSAKEFSLSGDWSKFVADLNSSGLQKLLDNAALLSSVIPGLGALVSGAALANRLSGGGASGASGVDEAGFAGLGSVNVPMPRSRPNVPATFDERFTAANLQKQIGAMGEAATAADRLKLSQLQLSIASKEVGLSSEQLSRAQDVLKLSFEQQQLQGRISLLGEMASVEERVAATGNAIALARAKGIEITNEESRAIIYRTRVMAEASTVEARMADERRALWASPVDMRIERVLMRAGIPPESERGKAIADYMRMTDAIRDMGQVGENAFNAFAQSIAAGRTVTESLRTSMKGLASDLTSIGSKNVGQGLKGLLSGQGIAGFDPVSLGIGAAGMALGAFMGQQEKKKQEQITRYQAQIDAVNEANRKQTEAQQRLADEQVRIAEETQRRIEAAGARARSYQDIIFGATTDTSTLEGQMLALEREREQTILDEQKAGNENAYLVQAAFEAKRYALLKAANDNIVEEERRTAEERKSAMESAARTITDYLLNLRRGTDSPLSGSARLTAAQNAYNATRSLAQGGNLDALGRITQDAEAFRVAAQAMFGSGSGYQSVFNQIQQQLSSLPAVTESTDPVVRALNDIAKRQETVYFDTTAAATNTAASAATTQISLQNQQVSIQSRMLDALNEMNRLQALQSQTSTQPVQAPSAPAYTPTFHYADWKRDYDQIALFNQSQSNVNSWLPFPSQSNPKYTYRLGGMIPGYANGGMVGNGIWDRDSVLARYAGGGHIGLAGGEFVMPAPQTRAFLPQLEAMRSGGGANDNAALVAEVRALRKEVAMMLGQNVKATIAVAGEVKGGFDNQNRVIRNSETAASEGVRARNRGRTGTHG